ncbi:hypothetical protein WG66_013577 [Moniliophthora roreri]|nr:hypothetical protein WG66_013577 [Moniliophthora roreri]
MQPLPNISQYAGLASIKAGYLPVGTISHLLLSSNHSSDMRFSYGALPFVLAAVVLVSGSPASPIVDLDTVTPTATVTLGGCGPELFTTTYDSFTITYCKPTVITGSGAATATTVTPVITSSTAAVTSFVNNDGTYTSFPPLTATVTLGCDPTPTLHTTTYDSFTITYCDATSTITPLPPYCSTYLACDPTPTFLTTTYDTFTITYCEATSTVFPPPSCSTA